MISSKDQQVGRINQMNHEKNIDGVLGIQTWDNSAAGMKQLANWLLPNPEDLGSNPATANYNKHMGILCLLRIKTKINKKRPGMGH